MNKRIVFPVLIITVLVVDPQPSQARWMNPNTGRFHTMDTFEGSKEDPQTLHRYVYCHANPLNRFDPTGLADYTLSIIYAGVYAGDKLGWGGAAAGVGLSFRDDWTGTDIVVGPVGPNDNIFDAVYSKIEARHLGIGSDRITEISIFGHGFPGAIGTKSTGKSDITLPSLTTPKQTLQKRLLHLLQFFTHDNCTVYLKGCKQGIGPNGQSMMKAMARQLGPNVKIIGWDDTYALFPFGNEWTATWDGKSEDATISKTAPGVSFGGIGSVIDRIIFDPIYTN